MSRGKKAGIIAGCVIAIVVAIIVKIAISNPGTTPAPQTGTEGPPSAEFTVTGFYQVKAYTSSYVGIYYEVHNTGQAHIRYYSVDFTITFDDGSQHTTWANGRHVFAGQVLPNSTVQLIQSLSEVKSVEIDSFQLTAGSIPDEYTSVDFDITGFRQTCYETLEEWAAHVYVDYTIQNTGAEYVEYYRAYITVTCDDGSEYRDMISVRDVLAGEKRTDSHSVHVSGKKVTSVELANFGTLALSGPTPEVIYEVTGTAESVFVTLSNATGGIEQYSNVYLPHRYIFTSFPGSSLSISAQNQDASGTVTVSIYVDGKLFRTSSSSGAYVIATASELK